MLETLNIKNFAIIKDSSLSFNLGFNVLIGQTGAGKSIIINAIRFVLGDKPNKDNIRTGESEMQVKAVFSNISLDVENLLDKFDIPKEEILIVSRTFNIDGKSSCHINGEVVTVSMLKQIGAYLVDVYGQHDGTKLLDSKNHLALLDNFNPNLLYDTKQEIQTLLNNQKEINQEIADIGGADEDRERTLDILNYQIQEIQNSNLVLGEDIELENSIQTLSNYEKIANSVSTSYLGLQENNLNQSLTNLQNASQYDSNLESLATRLQSAIIEIEDISSSLQEYMSNMSFSESELDNLTQRLESIKSLKKKYGKTIEDILTYLEECRQKYENITNSEQILNNLKDEQSKINSQLFEASLKLHNKRVEIAKEIETKVEKELCGLGMKKTTFSVGFNCIPQKEDAIFTKDGFDKVEFLFSANAGEQQKSLSKTISGGELSRFMLAIKNVFASSEQSNLLIFDEIDSGVSGEIGYLVGQKLAILSQKFQIICITHLPQVTCLADKFIYIQKQIQEGHTTSNAKYLDEKELASYLITLFGAKESEVGLLHANELISMAKSFKSKLNK